MLDMAVVNSWIIYKLLHPEKRDQMDLLDYRRAVCVPYLKLYNTQRIMSRKQSIAKPPKPVGDVRFDGKAHVVAMREKKRRCQNKSCKKKPVVQNVM